MITKRQQDELHAIEDELDRIEGELFAAHRGFSIDPAMCIEKVGHAIEVLARLNNRLRQFIAEPETPARRARTVKSERHEADRIAE